MVRNALIVWENVNSGPVSLRTLFQWALQSAGADRLLATESSFLGPAKKRSFKRGVLGNARQIFGKHLLKTFEAQCWPGTRKIGHTGRVYVAQFNESLAQRMIAIEDDLFKWLNPSPKKLVEDLCLFREGAKHPLFASVTHERDAYIISAEAVPVPGFEGTEYGTDEMLLAWEGEYFCRP